MSSAWTLLGEAQQPPRDTSDEWLTSATSTFVVKDEDIRDDLTACGRAVDGKCGFVGGPCRASHAQALRKSEESRIQGHHCPTQTSKERGVVTWATKRGDTGRLGA